MNEEGKSTLDIERELYEIKHTVIENQKLLKKILELMSNNDNKNDEKEIDPLFNEAVEKILDLNYVSVSIIQRKLRIGYTRATRIIEAMEEKGIISKLQGTKPRKVLISKEYWDMIKDNNVWKVQYMPTQ